MPVIEEIVNATNFTGPYAPDYTAAPPMILGGEEDNSKTWSAFIMTMTAMMVLFFIGAGVVEKYKPVICHETGLVLVVGIIFSWVYYAAVGPSKRDVFQFSQGVFFDFFLPPIIINSGYNMRRKKFF
jgi:sodium/hydrogen exchanger-like protein 6/7